MAIVYECDRCGATEKVAKENHIPTIKLKTSGFFDKHYDMHLCPSCINAVIRFAKDNPKTA